MNETRLSGESFDIVSDNISKLKELFPEVITEDKIDFEKLKLVLGEDIETESERYNFTWPGKTQAIKEAQKQSTGTLRPCKEESKNWDTTKNLYIEGDNLEVLKLLQKGYYNKIKVIYIDPPYNTGNDFIYNDSFNDNLQRYLEITNQISSDDENYFKISTNSETNGRFHTNWLNMMYPRLKLARNLLTDDGIIFISIDDNEFENLKRICDEIFGEYNFIGSYIKQSKVGGGSDSKFIVKEHEYCLVFAKNIVNANEMFVSHDLQYLKRYKEIDDDGRFFWDTFARPGLQKNSKESLIYDIICPDGTKIRKRWIRSKERFEKELSEGKIRIIQKENGEWSVQFKQYLNSKGKKPRSMTMDFGGSIEGKKDINDLFNNDKVFPYPKSSKFISTLLKTIDSEDFIVLDFFSGSSTTAHSIFNINADDDGKRRFIMVQIPESIDEFSEAFNLGYKNICEIGKERIRRAGDKIVQESGNKDLDIGFKVFKLDSSNLNKWDPDYDDLEQTLLVSQDNIKSDRTQEDLIYEIMLKYGIDLTLPIEEYDAGENKIYSIGFGALLICLDNKITKDITDSIIELASEDVSRVVFKDNGFASDADKTNIKETLRSHNIDEFITI